MKGFASVDAYIANYPEPVQEKLLQIRRAIKQVVPPEATEKISYGIPAFTYNGNLIHYGAFKDHLSLFPKSDPIVAFKDELKGYKTAKGTIHLPLDKPVPVELIQKIALFCIEQNKARKM